LPGLVGKKRWAVEPPLTERYKKQGGDKGGHRVGMKGLLRGGGCEIRRRTITKKRKKKTRRRPQESTKNLGDEAEHKSKEWGPLVLRTRDHPGGDKTRRSGESVWEEVSRIKKKSKVSVLPRGGGGEETRFSV